MLQSDCWLILWLTTHMTYTNIYTQIIRHKKERVQNIAKELNNGMDNELQLNVEITLFVCLCGLWIHEWTELHKLCLNEWMKRKWLDNGLGYNVYVHYNTIDTLLEHAIPNLKVKKSFLRVFLTAIVSY